MAGTIQEIRLNGTQPTEFKIVIVPFYRTTGSLTQGDVINAGPTTGTPILVPVTNFGGETLVSLTVIYQMGCVLTSIPGINIPADNRPINLHFVQTGCVNFLTTGEPLNGMPECCDIHAE